jgi:hypothetical protein
MALKKCKECGKKVSTKADKCPNCGAPIEKETGIGCLGFTLIIFAVGLIIGLISNAFIEKSQEKKWQEQTKITEQKIKAIAKRRAAIRKKNVAFFTANKSAIILELTDYYEKGKYQQVVTKAKKYLGSNNPDLKKIYDSAKSKVDEIKRKKKEEKLLAQLKIIPAIEFEKNKNLYHELLSLYPSNIKYKKKFNYYSSKLKEKRAKQKRIAERKKKIERQFSESDALQNVDLLRSNGVILSISLLDQQMMYVTVSRKFYNMTAREKRGFGGLLSLAYPNKCITVADAYTEKLVLSILPNGYTRIIK